MHQRSAYPHTFPLHIPHTDPYLLLSYLELLLGLSFYRISDDIVFAIRFFAVLSDILNEIMFPFQILSFTLRKVLGWTPFPPLLIVPLSMANNFLSLTLLHTLSRPLSQPTLWTTLAYKPFLLAKTFLPAASILKTIVDPLTQNSAEKLHPCRLQPWTKEL